MQEYVDSAHEKEFYRNHYNQGEMQHSHSLGNLAKQSSYVNPTKQVKLKLYIVLLRNRSGHETKR